MPITPEETMIIVSVALIGTASLVVLVLEAIKESKRNQQYKDKLEKLKE